MGGIIILEEVIEEYGPEVVTLIEEAGAEIGEVVYQAEEIVAERGKVIYDGTVLALGAAASAAAKIWEAVKSKKHTKPGAVMPCPPPVTAGGGGDGGDGGSGKKKPKPLSNKARSKLGNLAGRAEEKVADVIRSRGGSGSNVQEVGHWAERTLGEAAESAVQGDAEAEKAVKMAKQAARKGQRY